MAVEAAGIDGVDQHALGAEARGGVDGFGEGMIDKLSDIERGLIFVAVDAKATGAAEYVVATGITYAVLHDATVLGTAVDLVDVVDAGLKVVGMDARFPVIATVVYVLRGKAKIAQGTL